MELHISPQEIENCKRFLEQHPLNHGYDESIKELDNNVPIDQLIAKACYEILKSAGEITD
jgi:hypothetical protein